MRLTLYGMLNYDNDLFAGVVLPEGMDKNLLTDLIIEEAGDLWPYYQALPHFKRNIGNWFTRKLPLFQKMYDVLNMDYNPIENYDRHESGKESPNVTVTETPNITHLHTPDITIIDSPDIVRVETPDVTVSSTVHREGSEARDETIDGNNTNTGKVSAFDTAAFVDRDQNIVDDFRQTSSHAESNDDGTSVDKTTGTVRNTESGTNTRRESGTRTETESGTRTHVTAGDTRRESHIHGNIGVTTTQQMIQAELDLRLYDLYDTICRMFIDHFIITLY